MLPSYPASNPNSPSMDLKTDWSCLEYESTNQHAAETSMQTPSSALADSILSASHTDFSCGVITENECSAEDDIIGRFMKSPELADEQNVPPMVGCLLDSTAITESAVSETKGVPAATDNNSTSLAVPVQAIVLQPELRLEPPSMLEVISIVHPVTSQTIAASDNPWLIWVAHQRLERNRMRQQFPMEFMRLTNLRVNIVRLLTNFQEHCPTGLMQHFRGKITTVHHTVTTELMDNLHFEKDLPRGYAAIVAALRACNIEIPKSLEHPLRSIASALACRESATARRIAAVKQYPLLLNHVGAVAMTDRDRTLICNLWCHPHVKFGNTDVMITPDKLVKIADSTFVTRYRRTIIEVENNFMEWQITQDPKRKSNLMKMMKRKKVMLLSENHLFGKALSERTMEILKQVDGPM